MAEDKAGTANAFHGGGFFDDIGSDFSALERKSLVVSCDVPDAWYDASPKVLSKLREHLPWLMKNSPPQHGDGLIKTICAKRGLQPENVLLGAGSSDLMYATFPNLLKSSDRVVVLDPMYGEYVHILDSLLKCEIARCAQSAQSDFVVDIDKVLEASRGAKMVIVVNPNNPTGQPISRESLRKLVDGVSKDTIVFVDEAYVDYVMPAVTVEGWVADRPNLMVLKSMSKFYGLSGCRVGYLVAPKAIAQHVRRFQPPWCVSTLAQVAAVEALLDEDYYYGKVRETHQLREEMAAELAKIPGLRLIPSVTNYILMELTDLQSPKSPTERRGASRLIAEYTRRSHVFIRDCTSQSVHFNGRFIRTAVKDPTSNSRVVEALRAAMAEYHC
jgi:histidinol-phosphate aminotransferase